MSDAWIAPAADARALNAVANHPSVRPWVAGSIEGPLDLGVLLSDRKTICLVGQFGFAVFRELRRHVHDMHAAALPSGRGRWALNFGRAAITYIFTRTDAVAVLASIPQPNRGARQIAGALGFKLVCVSPAAWPMPTGAVALHHYVLLRKDWEILDQ